MVLVIFGIICYKIYPFFQKNNYIPPIDPSVIARVASSTDTSVKTIAGLIFTASTADTSIWKMYNASRNSTSTKYSLIYPPDMITSMDGQSLVLTFPKETYFHWPLLDDTKVTVTASSTCSQLAVPSNSVSVPTTTMIINGHEFTRIQGDDVAAGNRYQEIAYDTIVNKICFHVSLFDHGANGAGLYVSDPALVSQYDTQHDQDLSQVLNVFNGILGNLTIGN